MTKPRRWSSLWPTSSMMSKSAKNLLKRYPSQEAPPFPDGSLVIHLYGDVDTPSSDLYVVKTTPGEVYLAEELCHLAGQKLELGPLALQLFSLVTPDLTTWLAPNDQVTCPRRHYDVYTFRMRVRPHIRHIEQRSFGAKAFEYLFLQVRQDFISDCAKDLESEKTLGLGVIDIHRYGKERQLTEKNVLDLPLKRFLPQSVKKNFSKIRTLLLKNGLKTELRKEYAKGADTSSQKIKLQYVNGWLEYVPTYMAEEFTLQDGDKLTLDHYHERFPGISRLDINNQRQSVCQMEDIMDISLPSRDKTIVINYFEESPDLFTFRSLEEARSFIALVDSYRRLTVDYYFHVCSEVQSPMLLNLNKLRIHGPVNMAWAKINLQEQNRKNPEINYLVRQRNTGTDSYILLFIKQTETSKKIIPLAINQLDTGKYQVHLPNEPLFDALPDLLRHYESSNHQLITLHKRLSPNTVKAGDDTGLYVCKPLPQIEEEEEEEELEHHTTSRGQQHATVNLVTEVKVIQDCPLGSGQFTDVYKGFWCKEPTNIQMVAVKQLKAGPNAEGLTYQALLEAAHILAFWNHATIVRCIGLCLHPFQVLEEQAELGGLENYLQNPHSTLYIHHLVTIAEQIAQAIRYLEEPNVENRVHGNIRCRNILVFNHTDDNVKVKLGDRGMLALYNRHGIRHPYNLERLPWLAPELHDNPSKMTVHSDRFAFGITLWELFSLGDRPFLHMEYTKIFFLLKRGTPLECPQKCPAEIYSLMTKCWREYPGDRIRARELVRDIRNVNSAMDPMLSAAEAESHYNNENLGDLPEQAMVVMRAANHQEVGGSPDFHLLPFQHPSPSPGAATTTVLTPSALSPILLTTPGGSTGDLPLPVPANAGADWSTANGLNEVAAVTDQPSYEHILKRENLTIEKGNQLGQGFFGKVHRGLYNSRIVAVKSLRNTNMTSTSRLEFENEFKLMVKFQHPNIVEIIGQCPGQGPGKAMSLVMEFVENGCLVTYIRNRKNEINCTTLLRFCEEVAQGMKYLSSQSVVHRDLAARNVLVTRDITMKISDFGLSRNLETNRNYYKCHNSKEIPIRWCAPESQLYFKFSTKSDVWSYGITVWEIFSYGETPKLCEDRNLHNELYCGKRLKAPAHCPHIIYKLLMLKCWEYYEQKRPDFSQIVTSVHDLQERRVCEPVDGGGCSPPAPPSPRGGGGGGGEGDEAPTSTPPTLPILTQLDV